MRTNNCINIGLGCVIVALIVLQSCRQEGNQAGFSEAPIATLIDTVAIQDTAVIPVVDAPILKDNLLDRMNQRAQISQFVFALKTAGIDSILKFNKGPFTIFAVLNEQEIVTAEQSKNMSTQPASYIVKGAYSTPNIYQSFSSIRQQTSFKTMDEKQISIYDLQDTLFFEFDSQGRRAYFYATDLFASNGIVHIIKFLDD